MFVLGCCWLARNQRVTLRQWPALNPWVDQRERLARMTWSSLTIRRASAARATNVSGLAIVFRKALVLRLAQAMRVSNAMRLAHLRWGTRYYWLASLRRSSRSSWLAFNDGGLAVIAIRCVSKSGIPTAYRGNRRHRCGGEGAQVAEHSPPRGPAPTRNSHPAAPRSS